MHEIFSSELYNKRLKIIHQGTKIFNVLTRIISLWIKHRQFLQRKQAITENQVILLSGLFEHIMWQMDIFVCLSCKLSLVRLDDRNGYSTWCSKIICPHFISCLHQTYSKMGRNLRRMLVCGYRWQYIAFPYLLSEISYSNILLIAGSVILECNNCCVE